MNSLTTIFIIVLIGYLLYHHLMFCKYYILVLVIYHFISVLINRKSNTTLKIKNFIACWQQPYDPFVYGTQTFNVTKLLSYLREYSQKNGYKIGITIFIMKICSEVLKKYPQINGSTVFGKFYAKSNIDVGCMISTDGGNNCEIITIRDCDKLSISEISKDLFHKKESIDNKSDAGLVKRSLIAHFVPSFFLSLYVGIVSYLSAAGFDLSLLGFQRHAYASMTLCNLGKLGINNAYMPIPCIINCIKKSAYTYSGILVNLSQIKTKFEFDENDSSLKENSYLTFYITVDHRYLDGSLAGKIIAKVEHYINNPELLIIKSDN